MICFAVLKWWETRSKIPQGGICWAERIQGPALTGLMKPSSCENHFHFDYFRARIRSGWYTKLSGTLISTIDHRVARKCSLCQLLRQQVAVRLRGTGRTAIIANALLSTSVSRPRLWRPPTSRSIAVLLAILGCVCCGEPSAPLLVCCLIAKSAPSRLSIVNTRS
jgi:hypothetical protein